MYSSVGQDYTWYNRGSPSGYPNLNQPAASAPGWEDCSICLENCGENPEGNASYAKVVAKTECNHFFHDFCLNRHLNNGMNQNCPNCRHDLSDRNITRFNLDNSGSVDVPGNPFAPSAPPASPEDQPSSVADDVQQSNDDEAPGLDSYEAAANAIDLIGRGVWFLGSNLLGVGWTATKFFGGVLSDFVWPKEVSPRSIQLIHAEVDRIHNEINAKIQEQHNTMRVLLAQVASIGQDRSRNPVASLNEIRRIQNQLTSQANSYLKETDALIRQMQTVSQRF